MAKFRKNPVVIEATQWFKDGDHPAVRFRPAEIIFDRAEAYYYVSHGDSAVPMANAWIAVDPSSTTAAKHGSVLPFAFYEVKSGKRAPISEYRDLYETYAKYSRWTQEPRNMGVIDTSEGAMMVTPGDWVITGVKGEHYPCKPDIFEQTYTLAEETTLTAISMRSPAMEVFNIRVPKDDTYLTFERGPAFREAMQETSLLIDGRTVGKAREDELHKELQTWIDRNKE